MPTSGQIMQANSALGVYPSSLLAQNANVGSLGSIASSGKQTLKKSKGSRV